MCTYQNRFSLWGQICPSDSILGPPKNPTGDFHVQVPIVESKKSLNCTLGRMRPGTTHQLVWLSKQHFEQDIDGSEDTRGNRLKESVNDVQ